MHNLLMNDSDDTLEVVVRGDDVLLRINDYQDGSVRSAVSKVREIDELIKYLRLRRNEAVSEIDRLTRVAAGWMTDGGYSIDRAAADGLVDVDAVLTKMDESRSTTPAGTQQPPQCA